MPLQVQLVEQELLTLLEHLSSPSVFSGIRVTRSLVLYLCFVDRCLSFCTFREYLGSAPVLAGSMLLIILFCFLCCIWLSSFYVLCAQRRVWRYQKGQSESIYRRRTDNIRFNGWWRLFQKRVVWTIYVIP
jgi:hypothetical protein